MTKLLRDFVCLQAGILIVLMLTACGVDPYKDEYFLPTKFVKATPPGGEISANSSITIIFDNHPRDFRVSTGTAIAVGKTARISGPFPLGPLELIITWADGYADGTQVLNFMVHSGGQVADGTVRDGDTDVD